MINGNLTFERHFDLLLTGTLTCILHTLPESGTFVASFLLHPRGFTIWLPGVELSQSFEVGSFIVGGGGWFCHLFLLLLTSLLGSTLQDA